MIGIKDVRVPTGASLRSLADGYILTHQTEGRSPHTVAYYTNILGNFLWYTKRQGWSDDARLITEWHVKQFLGYVATEVNRWGKAGNGSESSAKRASPRTLHHYYRALHSFFLWTVSDGYLTESPVDKVNVKKPKPKSIKPYSHEEVERMLAVCDWDCQHNAKFVGSRNRAIVMLLLDTGMRLSELVGMKQGDIDKTQGWIHVLGKGQKERTVRMGKVAQKTLWRYLMHRPDNGVHVWLTEEGGPLKARGVQSAVERLKERAGVDSSGSVHRFRHTFALSFLRADRNPFNLQYLLGHNSLEMVRHYTSALGMEDALTAHINASPADLMGLR